MKTIETAGAKPTPKELRAMLVRARDRAKHTAEQLGPQRENPTVAPQYHKAMAEWELLDDVMDALDGFAQGLKTRI